VEKRSILLLKISLTRIIGNICLDLEKNLISLAIFSKRSLFLAKDYQKNKNKVNLNRIDYLKRIRK